MSINKIIIPFTGKDKIIKISLDSVDSAYGQQQSISNAMNDVTNGLINPIVDIETSRFKYNPTLPAAILSFYFHINGSHTNTFESGLTENMLLNSFFMLDFYDTYDTYTQTKIFRTYLTKVGEFPQYQINAENQYNIWYVPQSFIDSSSGGTALGYVKFSFYNALTGLVSTFYNYNNRDLKTNEKMFFKSELNISNRTWKIITTSFPSILAYEFPATNLYSNRINNTVNNVEQSKPNYSPNLAFDYQTQTYVDLNL